MRIEENSPLVGKSFSEIGFRKKYGVTVIAIQRNKQTIANPSGDISLLAHDIIILIGTRESIAGISSAVLSSESKPF
jgi:K+/H+ antiporter YhaU regulatory subunit KhtT